MLHPLRNGAVYAVVTCMRDVVTPSEDVGVYAPSKHGEDSASLYREHISWLRAVQVVSHGASAR